MVKLNDISFSDIYITPDKTAFIGDNRTENGLKIIEAEDFEAFYNLVEKSWDGNNPSYSVLFERTFYRVERSVALYGVQYCARKMPQKIPPFASLGFNHELTTHLLSLSTASGLILWSGPTGAGKTTMVNLLMRFYEISGGTISIDGIDTKSVPRWNVHDQFSMVLQDTWVFRGTVRENIAYSKKDVTDEQIVAACKAVGLHHYIMSLPNGYDTVLDDKASLSQGQRQLLTIARAMVEDAPILILDEATSALDTESERLVQEALENLMRNRTTIVIAHRLSTIRNADEICVMHEGEIVERGRHEELIALDGYYKRLCDMQSF